MDKSQLEADLLTTYQDLLSINHDLLHIALKERYEEQIIDIMNLEEKKMQHFTSIEKMFSESDGYVSLSESIKEKLISYVSEIQTLNHKLQDIINEWYNIDSKAMKQVRTHRTTLQAYGGVNNADFVSYYIDHKK